jgi:hypothetical protein
MAAWAGRQCELPYATSAGTGGYQRPRTRRTARRSSAARLCGIRAVLTGGRGKRGSRQGAAAGRRRQRGIGDSISRRFPRVASIRNGCRYPFPRLRRSQHDQDYTDDNKHSGANEFSACDQISESLPRHKRGVVKARPQVDTGQFGFTFFMRQGYAQDWRNRAVRQPHFGNPNSNRPRCLKSSNLMYTLSLPVNTTFAI